MRATSSAISGMPVTSSRQDGIVATNVLPSTFTPKDKVVKILTISSSAILVPKYEFTASLVKDTVRTSFAVGYTSITPFATVAPGVISNNNCAARSKASGVTSLFTPRSKRPDASERKPNAREVRRMDAPLNTAASNTTVVVSLDTSLSAPPITPATPTGRSASAITSIVSANVRSLLSKV